MLLQTSSLRSSTIALPYQTRVGERADCVAKVFSPAAIRTRCGITGRWRFGLLRTPNAFVKEQLVARHARERLLKIPKTERRFNVWIKTQLNEISIGDPCKHCSPTRMWPTMVQDRQCYKAFD